MPHRDKCDLETIRKSLLTERVACHYQSWLNRPNTSVSTTGGVRLTMCWLTLYEPVMENRPSALQRLLGHRRMSASLAALIGTVSGWMLLITSVRLYFEYYVYPRLKAQDGYSYPEWRYRLFDLVLAFWCIDGLVASALLFRSVILHRNIEGWPYRTTVLFFGLLAVLVLGVAFGIYLRSRGI
jgi:hypothetical protein